MKFGAIELERRSKIESLFLDRIENETELFLRAVEQLNLKPQEIDRIKEALAFALAQKYGLRETDKYYCAHPIRVARFCAEWAHGKNHKTLEMIITSLIHNFIEKEVLPSDQINKQFGRWISQAIVILTPNRSHLQSEEGRAEYYRQLVNSGVEIQMIKAFDKFDNIFALCLNPSDKIRCEYLDEIDRFVRPIISEHVSELLAYFDDLVKNTRQLGHLPFSLEHGGELA